MVIGHRKQILFFFFFGNRFFKNKWLIEIKYGKNLASEVRIIYHLSSLRWAKHNNKKINNMYIVLGDSEIKHILR